MFPLCYREKGDYEVYSSHPHRRGRHGESTSNHVPGAVTAIDAQANQVTIKTAQGDLTVYRQ